MGSVLSMLFKVTRFLMIGVLSLSFFSCVDNLSSDVYVTKDEIRFVPKTNNEYEAVQTKAALSSFPADRSLVLSASYTPTGGTASSFFSGITFTRGSGASEWSGSSKKYWPRGGSVDFLAYSTTLGVTGVSWGTNSTGSVQMTVPDNSTEQDDILVGAKHGQTQTSGSVSIAFSHAQALLSFTGKADEAYNASNNVGVTITSIVVNNGYFGGTLLATRSNSSISFTWSGLNNQKATVSVPGAAADLTTAAASVGQGIMLPGGQKPTITVNYRLHNGKDASGNAVNLDCSYTITPSANFAAGNRYEYAISFSEGEISVSGGLNAWDAASQTWFYATGDAVSHQGTNFPFNSATNIWWRLDGTSSYEPLTFVEGTWGDSVKLEATSYYVTITKDGSNYLVSYTTKRYLDRLELRNGTSASAKVYSTYSPMDTILVSMSTSGIGGEVYTQGMYFYAVYSDGEEVALVNSDVTYTVTGPNTPVDYRPASSYPTSNYKQFRLSMTGTYSFTFSYTDAGNQTKSVVADISLYRGTFQLQNEDTFISNSSSSPYVLKKGSSTQFKLFGSWNDGTYTDMTGAFSPTYYRMSASMSNNTVTVTGVDYAKPATISWNSGSCSSVFGPKAGTATVYGPSTYINVIPTKYPNNVVIIPLNAPNSSGNYVYFADVLSPAASVDVSPTISYMNYKVKVYYDDGTSVEFTDLATLRNSGTLSFYNQPNKFGVSKGDMSDDIYVGYRQTFWLNNSSMTVAFYSCWSESSDYNNARFLNEYAWYFDWTPVIPLVEFSYSERYTSSYGSSHNYTSPEVWNVLYGSSYSTAPSHVYLKEIKYYGSEGTDPDSEYKFGYWGFCHLDDSDGSWSNTTMRIVAFERYADGRVNWDSRANASWGGDPNTYCTYNNDNHYWRYLDYVQITPSFYGPLVDFSRKGTWNDSSEFDEDEGTYAFAMIGLSPSSAYDSNLITFDVAISYWNY